MRNKCKEAIRLCHGQGRFQFVNWSEDVEVSSPYIDAFSGMKRLYEESHSFQKDVMESSNNALQSLKKNRQKSSMENGFNLEEGVNYLLKELAFFSVVNNNL